MMFRTVTPGMSGGYLAMSGGDGAEHILGHCMDMAGQSRVAGGLARTGHAPMVTNVRLACRQGHFWHGRCSMSAIRKEGRTPDDVSTKN